MDIVLASLGLGHLSSSLSDECPRGCAYLCSDDRPALLRRLLRLGVQSLKERQAIANELLRLLRAERLPPPRHHRSAIAFLFLVYEGMPHEGLWRSFFDEVDPSLYGAFVHQKYPRPLKHFAGCSIPTIPTSYGTWGIVEAELALLRTALTDERRFVKFVLCSGACVPLKPFVHCHRLLTQDDLAHFAEFDDPPGRYAGRLMPLGGTVPTSCFAKHSQWWVLNRRVATLVTSQPAEYESLWQASEVPDEHFFLTTVRHRRVESADAVWDAGGSATPADVACYTPDKESGDFTFPTFVCWGEAVRSPPIDWNGEHALRPRTYTSLSVEQLEALLASPALFARKMGEGCRGLEGLREVYSSSSGLGPEGWAAVPKPVTHVVIL